MFKIERARAADFERVFPLLEKLNDAELKKEDWRKLFTKYWESSEDFCGSILVKDGEVKGFLAMLFSRRTFGGKVYKICNINSWIVEEDCRSQSVFLLLDALKLKDYVFTVFTASGESKAIPVLSRVGFEEIEIYQQILPPLPNVFLRGRGYTCEFDSAKIRERLSETERVIFDDHRQLGCAHLLLESDAGHAYVILKNTHRRNIPLAKVHYVSDAGHFAGGIEKFALKICRRLKVLGIMVNESYLDGRRLRTSVRNPKPQTAFFKIGAHDLSESQIDTLYSEMVVLFNERVAA